MSPQPSPRHKRKRRTIGKAAGNPTVVRGAVVAVLSILAGWGCSWATDLDPDVIVLVLGLLGPLVTAAWSRLAVTPNAKVVARVTTTGGVVAGDAALAPTGTNVAMDAGAGPLATPVIIGVAVNPELVQRGVI